MGFFTRLFVPFSQQFLPIRDNIGKRSLDMNQNNILDLLEKDARLNAQDLSDILNEPKDEIEKPLKN